MTGSIRTTILIAALGAASASSLALAQNAVRIANEGAIRDQWMLADGVTLVAPGYPASFAAHGDNVCVAMGYRIKPDGSTGEFTLLRSWSSSTGEQEPVAGFWDAFSQASASALMQWRFKPRPEVSAPRAVDTVATMTFMGKQAEDPAGLRAHCRIDDLASLIEKVKSDHAKRGDMNKHAIDEQYRRQLQNEMRANRKARGG